LEHNENTARDRATFTEEELDRLTQADRNAVQRANTAVDRLALLPARIRKSLGHKTSKRGKRRALALLLGHQDGEGRIRVNRFRTACRREGLLETRGDIANFTQDMRKDSTLNADRALWTIQTYRGYHRELSGYWLLTEKGARLAAEFGALVDTAQAEADAVEDKRFNAAKATYRKQFEGKRARLVKMGKLVSNSIKITKKSITCPYCREEMTPEAVATDYAECSKKCGTQAHASCVMEIRDSKRRCPANLGGYGQRYRNNQWCNGTYRIVVEPAGAGATIVSCHSCNDAGFTVAHRSGCHASADFAAQQSPEAQARIAKPCDAHGSEHHSGVCHTHQTYTVIEDCRRCARSNGAA
jgi:hypothetical protein